MAVKNEKKTTPKPPTTKRDFPSEAKVNGL